jgi:hypothetical protein
VGTVVLVLTRLGAVGYAPEAPEHSRPETPEDGN